LLFEVAHFAYLVMDAENLRQLAGPAERAPMQHGCLKALGSLYSGLINAALLSQREA
jgi:hypothetical protein